MTRWAPSSTRRAARDGDEGRLTASRVSAARRGRGRVSREEPDIRWTAGVGDGESRAMDIRIQCLCVDTPHPAKIASFWQEALGWRRTWDEPDQVCLEPPTGSPEDGVVPDLLFLRVPEAKMAKNRLHLDLRPKDQAAEVARLEGLGRSGRAHV